MKLPDVIVEDREIFLTIAKIYLEASYARLFGSGEW